MQRTAHKFPTGHWKVAENRRKFLDSIATKFNIKSPKDWGSITNNQIVQHGGGGLLSNYYQNSLFEALENIYPTVLWKKDWFTWHSKFPKDYWKDYKNRKTLFDSIARDLFISSPKDWGKVTLAQIGERGGASLVYRYYGGSVLKALMSIYPDIPWQRKWFQNVRENPRNYWKPLENQKKFLDNISLQLNIQNPEQWSKQLIHLGGSGVLSYYRNSIFRMLQKVYPEIHWERRWFVHLSKFPKNFWVLPENQKVFLKGLALRYHLRSPVDWLRVSTTLISKRGGSGLLKIHKGSIMSALKEAFPLEDWDSLEKPLFNYTVPHSIVRDTLHQWI